MVIQRGKENVVALVPGRLVADGHSHTVEKYSKFAYSSKFGFSIMRSNVTLAECAPDSMLAFEAYGYFFVKDVIDPDFTVSDERLIFSWSPIKGIHVKTTIEPTQTGHIRIHEITSDVECKAYDCGFAVSTDDRKPYSRTENEDTSCVENEDGYCSVRAVEGDGAGQVLIPDPNTNLMSSKTSIPMAVYAIRPGVQTIRTQVDYL